VSRPTQDTAMYINIYMYGTVTLCDVTFQKSSISYLYTISQSYNPDLAETKSVWAVPRSIATT
jgi:hypothetical protein